MPTLPGRPCRHPSCPAIVRERGKSYCEKHAKAVKRGCAEPGCPAIIGLGERYCQKHQAQADAAYDEHRGSRHERGYDHRWGNLRRAFLASNPICARCERAGRVEPATMVHHIIPIRDGGDRLDNANLEALCRPCHEKIHRRKRA
jgi:5-methylcytosine-specific restriction enzyme A